MSYVGLSLLMMVKQKRATPWKPGKVISIRLRNGVYVLAQMVRDPYLVFFNHFNEENNWKGVTLKEENILFCKAVTRQFLRYSPVAIIKEVNPLLDYELPKEWIYSHMGGHPITVSVKGRDRQVAGFGQRLSLVQADKESGQPEDNPLLGLFQAYILPDIQEQDWERVGQAELISIEVFPTLNERLYLCFLFGKNVNPELDISLGKPLPDEYETYLDILSNSPEARRLYLGKEDN